MLFECDVAEAPAKTTIMTRALRGVRKPEEREAADAAAAAAVVFAAAVVPVAFPAVVLA